MEGARSIVVAISCTLILALSQGMPYSVAPLVVEWLETFDEGQEKTGWVSSLNIASMFVTGELILFRKTLDGVILSAPLLLTAYHSF